MVYAMCIFFIFLLVKTQIPLHINILLKKYHSQFHVIFEKQGNFLSAKYVMHYKHLAQKLEIYLKRLSYAIDIFFFCCWWWENLAQPK